MNRTATDDEVMTAVCRALGRSAPLKIAPTPPAIDPVIARLVGKNDSLAEIFTQQCRANKINVETVSPPLLAGRLMRFLLAEKVGRVAVSASLDHLRIVPTLHQAGLNAKVRDEMTLDDLYDVDCGITDVYCGVAETGSLIVRAAQQGRAISLVPPLHVAIVHASGLVADLLDLFAKLEADGVGSAVSLISGPSKTSDIEMTLVVGVHGPMKVQVFLVQ